MQSSRSIYVVGKKNGNRELIRMIIDKSRNVALLKLKYTAAHKISRKKITPTDTFQFLLMGWTVHSIAMASKF